MGKVRLVIHQTVRESFRQAVTTKWQAQRGNCRSFLLPRPVK